MAFRGRGSYRSGAYAASAGQYGYPPPPEHNITRHPSCNLVELPDDWLQSLKQSWNVFKASEHVKRTLYSYLSNCENPYASALQIMAESNDFYHSKTKSMASFVIESFATWIAPQEDTWRHCLTKELKKEAFYLVTQQKNIALTRLVFKTFHLMENATDYLDQIRFMANCKMYKEACQCASLLNLTNYFTLEDFVLPLVLQDKHAVAEEALVQVPEMQKELVVMLDDLLSGGKNLAAEIDSLLMKLDVPDVKSEVFYYPKPLGKLIARLIKRFQLPSDLAPNLNKKRTGGALQFLIRKRYKDNLNSESWNEMVKEAVGDDPQLQMELVNTVNSYGDNHEALYWAHYFKISQDQWPYNVRLLDRDDPEAKYCQPKTAAEEDDGTEENWGNEDVAFHQLALSDSSLIMVDTIDAMNNLVHTFTYTGVNIAGMDSEWKPAFGGRQSELALVQVATNEKVFIIDVVNLAGKAPELWNQLGTCLFRNKEILKLGFDIGNDLQMIKTALPDLGQIKQNGHGYLDLALLWKRLTSNYKLILPYRDASNDSTSESLSQLVFLTLGRGLNKANQFSNWEQRPLRIGQLRYAALDAFCLLDVYQILRQCSEDQNIPFLEICDEIMLHYKGPRKSAGNNASKKKSSDMIQPAISKVPVTPRIDPAVNGSRSHSSVEEGRPSKQLWLNIAELQENMEKVREVVSTACARDPNPPSRKRDILEELDGALDRVGDHAQCLWQSGRDSHMEDREAFVHEGKKLIGSHRNESHQDVSRTPQYCWYHSRFGVDATNCQPPCDFDEEYNTEVLDGIRDNVDAYSQAAWEEVELCIKEFGELANDGVKFIRPQWHVSRQNDSRARHYYCFYHSRFGVDATNCQPPCDFDREYSFSEWCQRLIQILYRLSDYLRPHRLHSHSPSRSHHQSRNRSRNRPDSSSGDQSRDRSFSRSRSQSRNQSGSGSYSRSRNRSRGESFNKSRKQSPQWSHSRVPNRSRTPSRDRYYGSTRSPPSPSSSQVICWYHREFGESAKCCHSPCDFYDDYCTEYSSNW